MLTGKCPNCGKTLTVSDPSRDFIFCEYCGTKIRINVNFNVNYSKVESEHTERIVDEAKVKQAENRGRVIDAFAKAREQSRREEAEEDRRDAEEDRINREKQRIRKEKIMNGQYSFKEMLVDFAQSDAAKLLLWAAFTLIIGIGGSQYIAHLNSAQKHKDELDALNRENIAASRLSMGQASIPEFTSSDDARTFVKNLKDHGFVNVTSEAVPDLVIGMKNKEYEIIEVLVDGAPDYYADAWYPIDTDIVVRYHTYRDSAN